MAFTLSTHWNTHRHSSGEALVEEILELGFTHLELGYDLTMDLIPGIMKMVNNKSVTIDSVHNYCPVPVGAPQGHPELFLLASADKRIRENAIRLTARTIELAAQMGASIIVVHAGRLLDLSHMTYEMIALIEQGKQYTPVYDKIKLNLLIKREKKAPKELKFLYDSIEKLLPLLEKANVKLGIENLPSWETIPCESEMEDLCKHFKSPFIRYWHDIGHGQVRQNMGFISCKLWLQRLLPWLAGMHVHDVLPPAHDHIMPPNGNVDFASFKDFITADTLLVFEPSATVTPLDIKNALKILQEIWQIPSSNTKKETSI